MKKESHFRLLAGLLTAKDVIQPFIAAFDVKMSVSDTFNRWAEISYQKGSDPMEECALVTADSEPIGWISHDMLLAKEISLATCMEPLESAALLPADTSLIDVLKSFHSSGRSIFLVHEEKRFIGWIALQDLSKCTALQLCIFALILEIERLILEILLIRPRESCKLLHPRNYEKALEIYDRNGYQRDQRDDKPYPSRLLECTSLSDRLAVFKKDRQLKHQVPSITDTQFLKDLKDLRNTIAHPRSNDGRYALLEPKTLLPFIERAEKLEYELLHCKQVQETSYRYVFDPYL